MSKTSVRTQECYHLLKQYPPGVTLTYPDAQEAGFDFQNGDRNILYGAAKLLFKNEHRALQNRSNVGYRVIEGIELNDKAIEYDMRSLKAAIRALDHQPSRRII